MALWPYCWVGTAVRPVTFVQSSAAVLDADLQRAHSLSDGDTDGSADERAGASSLFAQGLVRSPLSKNIVGCYHISRWEVVAEEPPICNWVAGVTLDGNGQ